MFQNRKSIALVLMACALIGSACASAAPPAAAPTSSTSSATPMPTTAAAATSDMGHGTHGGSAGTPQAAAPFDATFIDAMIVHHQGAVTMAQEAQKQAQRPEIQQLAGEIIKAQEAEITQMREWRAAWYPGLAETGGMTDGMSMDMGAMAVSTDTTSPYDLRFIDAMIPHHESAIQMAQEAATKAEHAEIKTLAAAIIAAQTKEIEQMKQWRAAWAQ